MNVSKRRKGNERKQSIENGTAVDKEEEIAVCTNLAGDRFNIFILLVLYTLQGIPLGLAGAIPMLLQNKGISYKQQAEFSLVTWPFSLKLLWAPIVDALFWPKFGRRKTWLVPVQYLIGIMMLLMSANVGIWLDNEPPSIVCLTISFFILNFLAATQDIAVDGWALTMLKRCNVGHASTCNSVGQTAGFFLGYVVFMALESKSFCNSYLRTDPGPTGIVTLPGFLYFWGVVFIVTTTLIALFKGENPYVELNPHNRRLEDDEPRGLTHVKQAYEQLYNITKLSTVRTLALILLTAKIGFSACDSVSGLKLIEAKVPREDLALLAIPLVPVQILLPLVLSKHTTGQKPFSLWLKAFPLRLIVGPIVAGMVAITPFLLGDQPPSIFYLTLLVFVYMLHQACVYSMFVAVMAFFARVSDPTVGGTYMTLLNTLSNLGSNWPNTLALWAIDPLTYRSCTADGMNENECLTPSEKQECNAAGGDCLTRLDGYYLETAICFVLGLIWFRWGGHVIRKLQQLPLSKWHLRETNAESCSPILSVDRGMNGD